MSQFEIKNLKELLVCQEVQSFEDKANIVPVLLNISDLHIGNQDMRHLESLSCIKGHQIANREISSLFSKGKHSFDINQLENIPLRDKVLDLWNNKSVRIVSLTTTGEIIGILASDIINGSKTRFSGWG